ncbi:MULTISPECIES: YtxH domain-containing protein [Paenibacillus]|uniref:YtxH domain-containing protein n=1 Tax=Paenibacillus TaxID=44249 RepID=UPI0022B8E7CA|nr:YtxH domain-containing protein [Paenibacillus caseinilyticus]MCZ8518103.1 YtxH domain-containing protein [Paenibacillus caseinilyticus]
MTAPKKGKDLLVGAVVGTVLGAVTALLFAPKSGRELRSDIAEGAQQVGEKTQQLAAEVAEKSKQVVSVVSEKTQTAAGTISRQTSELAGKAKLAAVQVGQAFKKNGSGEGSDEVAAAQASVAATTADTEEQ